MVDRLRFCSAKTFRCVAWHVSVLLTVAPCLAQTADNNAPGAAPAQVFEIRAIDVVGVTRLGAEDVEKIVYPFVGPDKSATDIDAARKALQDAYAARGFEAVIVEAPADLETAALQGLVQLKVNEVPTGTVSVTGSKFHSTKAVIASIPSLASGRPVNFKDLQSEITAANRYPDRSITPRFKAGTVPGTIDAELRVRDSFPLHTTFELNNDNSPNTTPLRLSGSARYTSLWGLGHSLTAGFVIAPQNKNDSAVVSVSYSAPLLGSPWTLVAYGYKSNSNIAALGGTNVLGNGYQIGGRAIYRLPTENAYHAFSIGLDYKNFKQDIIVKGTTFKSPIEYIPLVLGYTFSKATESTQIEANLNTTLGLRILKQERCRNPQFILQCDIVGGFRNKDVDSIENFSHINLDASYTASFKGDWVTVARFSGQYADAHLVTNEQYAVGGVSTVRGYFQSEVVGDNGFNGSVEFRTPSIATYLGKFVDELRFFSFAEVGFTQVISPLLDQQSSFKIGSVGGGLRAKLFNRLSGDFVIGVPVADGTNVRKGDPRISFIAKSEF